MSNNRIEVEFGARTSELTAKAKEAAGDIRTFGDAVSSAAIKGGGAWTDMGRVFAEQGGTMGKSIGLVTAALGGLGAIVAALNDWVEQLVHWMILEIANREIELYRAGLR